MGVRGKGAAGPLALSITAEPPARAVQRAGLLARNLRMDSPRISMRWAL